MVMHYDICSGNVIDIEDTTPQVESPSPAVDTAIPRLMTVQEAVAIQRPCTPPPVDTALLPVEFLLEKWS